MTKKQKITLAAAFAAVAVILAIVAGALNYRATQEGMKEFQVEIISERDSYSEIADCESSAEFLGEFLRTYEICEWEESEYGIYITGFDGMQEDMENQYWWCITVNDSESLLGADATPLEDGSKYTFTLMQGWQEW